MVALHRLLPADDNLTADLTNFQTVLQHGLYIHSLKEIVLNFQ